MATDSRRKVLVVTVVALLLVVSCAGEAENATASGEEFVWTLDHTNYSEIISQHKMIVVEFYAPWCGYCQQLAPKYEEAAAVLSKNDPPVILAKMDTTVQENAELARNYTHNGVPSIKIFRNGGKTVHDYKGTRETEGIISYLKKHAGPASLEIKSKEDAANLIDEKKIVVAGIFPELSLEKIRNFTTLAEDQRVDFDFVHTLDAKFLPLGGPVNKPTIRLFKPFDERYADFEDFQIEAMQEFIEDTSVPIMAILDDNPDNQAFVNHFLHSPGDKVFLFLNFTTDLDAFKSKYYDIAVSYKGQGVNFLLGDADTGKRAIQYFGLHTDQVPLILVLTLDGKKYLQRHVQPDNLAAWLKDYKDGKLKPYLKSQPIPEVNNEPVKVVVADTLEDVVFNSGKDVLLEFYRLGCKFCEEFAPVLDEIALSFEKDPNILVAKIDGTENDVPGDRFEVQGYPTLYLVSSSGSLSRFDGNRTKEAIIEFVQTNRGTPAPSSTFVKESAADSTGSEKPEADPVKDEL